MQLHGCDTDKLGGPQFFLPYGQPGFIVDTTKFKKKLQPRAVQANYSRCLSTDTYQVYKQDKRRITSIRHSEFVLTLEKVPKKCNHDNVALHTDTTSIKPSASGDKREPSSTPYISPQNRSATDGEAVDNARALVLEEISDRSCVITQLWSAIPRATAEALKKF